MLLEDERSWDTEWQAVRTHSGGAGPLTVVSAQRQEALAHPRVGGAFYCLSPRDQRELDILPPMSGTCFPAISPSRETGSGRGQALPSR